MIAPCTQGEHRYPTDCYRYFPDGMKALAKWAGMNVLHASTGGFPSISESKAWHSYIGDTVLVAQKSPFTIEGMENPFPYESRWAGKYYDIYPTFEISVREACKGFDKSKPVVLIGTCDNGEEALKILGEENVYAFVGREMAGKNFCGKKVMSYKEYILNKKKYNAILMYAKDDSAKKLAILKMLGVNPGVLYPGLVGKSIRQLLRKDYC